MREIIIILFILLIIFGGAIYMTKFLNRTSEEIIFKLEELEKEILIAKESNNRDRANDIAVEIYEKWEEMDKTWSVLVLHDELDTIEISITKMKAQIKGGELEESLEELETTKFLINHIMEKEKLNLKNIF